MPDETYYCHCPQCGSPTATLTEGYCVDCAHENQTRLDQRNHEYDAWQTLTDEQIDAIIRNASQ